MTDNLIERWDAGLIEELCPPAYNDHLVARLARTGVSIEAAVDTVLAGYEQLRARGLVTWFDVWGDRRPWCTANLAGNFVSVKEREEEVERYREATPLFFADPAALLGDDFSERYPALATQFASSEQQKVLLQYLRKQGYTDPREAVPAFARDLDLLLGAIASGEADRIHVLPDGALRVKYDTSRNRYDAFANRVQLSSRYLITHFLKQYEFTSNVSAHVRTQYLYDSISYINPGVVDCFDPLLMSDTGLEQFTREQEILQEKREKTLRTRSSP